MNTIKRYFETTHPSKLYTFLLFLSNMASNAPYMFTPLVYGMIVKCIAERNFTTLFWLFAVYFGLKIFSKVAFCFNYEFTKKYYRSVYKNLKNGLVDKLEKLPAYWFTAQNKANILNVQNGDLWELCKFCDWLNKFSVYVVSFTVSAVVLLKTSIWLALIGVLIDTVVILLLNRFNQKYEKLIFASMSEVDKGTSFFSQLVNGINEIKVFNILGKLKKCSDDINEKYLEYNDKIIDNSRIRENIVPVITMTAEMLIMAFMTLSIYNGKFGVDTFVVVISYFGMLFSDLSSIVSSLGTLKIVKTSIDRYSNIMQTNVGAEQVFGNIEKSAGIGNIRFENVTFGYGNGNVLENFCADIQPKAITALVGESGSGKTTVFSMLTRIRRPQSGKITLDGTDIFDFSAEAYSECVSVIRQDPFIFGMSIYENLALINSDRDAVMSVCKKVHLHDYIMSLPQGYDTPINDNASDLSGGQKQRLAIARTLLKGSKVILCDEITSSLDKGLSDSIFGLLEELKKEHTIIIITHKPDEISRADNVIELKKGAVCTADCVK